ncbi:MAG: putative transcriptional regulator [Pseudomonadota bacterium]|jgi:transcriptional regulator
MYLPAHFTETRPEAIARILADHPLGMLVRQGPGGLLDADHIPFEFEPGADGAPARLRAHVARANPLWQEVPAEGLPVLVVFRGAEAAISPNWYPSKHEAHRQVPTWNYEVVHVHGRLQVHDDERWVRSLVARLTRRHEAAEPKPWKMGDAPPDYLDAMLKMIVGIEVEITALTAKSKLGQNKEARDRLGAAEALAAKGEGELAELMRQAGPAA